MDGLAIRALANEIETRFLESRIERIHQPSDTELVLTLRTRQQSERVLLSSHKQYARIECLMNRKLQNPESPPMLCVLFRKHIEGGRIKQVRQQDWNRTVEFYIESSDELGDKKQYILIHELMGKHSNIILTEQLETGLPGRIIESTAHVYGEMSRVREVLPGSLYERPPLQDKPAITDLQPGNLTSLLREDRTKRSNVMSLVHQIQGFGPVSAREALFRALSNDDEEDFAKAVYVEARALVDAVENATYAPTLGLDELGRPIEAAPFILTSAGTYTSVPTLLDGVSKMYQDVSKIAAKTRAHHSLLHAVLLHLDRLKGKYAKLSRELEDSQNYAQFQLYGELLTAYAYNIKKGQSEANVPNYYEDGTLLSISLDPALDAIENAQRYYRLARKRKRAIHILEVEQTGTRADLDYLEQVVTDLEDADLDNLGEIERDLISQGFLKPRPTKGKKRDTVRSGPPRPEQYRSRDGFTLLVGRNNVQNDRLSLRISQPDDLWFHVKDAPGSHVVIRTEMKDVPETTIEDAALLATWFSRGRNSANVAVDYTEVRHIWKPNGARPGLVLYDHQRTLFVTPDRSDIEPLLLTKEPH